ncbi:DnaJ domain-containing protein [Gracilibacillus boraciitolerans]|uniref:DnaJ domain-containing protein n=1 Tax=Gracilibacillus boraciitolerans TaxID=307521 RepID=UPI0009FDEFFE
MYKKEIKEAYRKLAKKNHPDTGGLHEDFIKIKQAYETLINDTKRAEYNYSTFADRNR